MTLDVRNNGELLFVRHGEVDFSWPDTCTGYQFDLACLKYRQATLKQASSPPPSLITQLTKRCNFLAMSSPLPRAIESTRRLLGNDEFQRNALLTEFQLPKAKGLRHVLTPKKWIYDLVEQFNQQGYGNEKKNATFAARVDKAINKILDKSLKFELVILVGHGIFNSILMEKLIQNGWIISNESGDEGYWSWKRLKLS